MKTAPSKTLRLFLILGFFLFILHASPKTVLALDPICGDGLIFGLNPLSYSPSSYYFAVVNWTTSMKLRNTGQDSADTWFVIKGTTYTSDSATLTFPSNFFNSSGIYDVYIYRRKYAGTPVGEWDTDCGKLSFYAYDKIEQWKGNAPVTFGPAGVKIYWVAYQYNFDAHECAKLVTSATWSNPSSESCNTTDNNGVTFKADTYFAGSVGAVTWYTKTDAVGDTYRVDGPPVWVNGPTNNLIRWLTCPSAGCSSVPSEPLPSPTSPPTPTSTATPIPTSTLMPTPTPACPICPATVLLTNTTCDGISCPLGQYKTNLSWTNVVNEESYKIYRCEGAACNINLNPPAAYFVTSLDPDVTTYTDNNDGAGFPPGTWKYEVRPFKTSCSTLNCTDYTNIIATPTPTSLPTSTPTPAPISCSANFNPSLGTVTKGDYFDLQGKISSVSGGDGSGYDFMWATKYNPGNYIYPPSVNPSQVGVWYPGRWDSTPFSPGTYQLIFLAKNKDKSWDNGVTCSSQAAVTVTNPSAWFQTREGDVHAKGDISSNIPISATNKFFSLNILGGYPGVVSYDEGASTNFGAVPVSSPGWLANTNLTGRNYSFFYTLAGSPTTPVFDENVGAPASGIYYAQGTVHIKGDWDLPSGRKIVILVAKDQGNANVIVQTNIDVAVGGFLAIITADQINIENAVSRVEGFFSADGHLSTGTGNVAFTGEGVFLAFSFALGRDLGTGLNRTTPAEKFLYRPDFMLNAHSSLWLTPHSWEELAP